jgi:hypothetical protein
MKNFLVKFSSAYQNNSNNILDCEGFTIIQVEDKNDIKDILCDFFNLEGPEFYIGDLECDIKFTFKNFEEYLDCFEILEISDEQSKFLVNNFLKFQIPIYGYMPLNLEMLREVEYANNFDTFDDIE